MAESNKNKDFLSYTESNPEMHVVEMDTVYNDIKTGPFVQTFKLSLNFVTSDYYELYALKSWHFGNAFLKFSTISSFELRRRTHELSHGTISIVARGF